MVAFDGHLPAQCLIGGKEILISFPPCAPFTPALSKGLEALESLLSTHGTRLQQENQWQQEKLVAVPTAVALAAGQGSRSEKSPRLCPGRM